MTELNSALDEYRRKRESFVWSVPPNFNFARDVVDRFAADPTRSATLNRDAQGTESRITFAQMSDWFHRFASLLETLDVKPWRARHRPAAAHSRMADRDCRNLGFGSDRRADFHGRVEPARHTTQGQSQ